MSEDKPSDKTSKDKPHRQGKFARGKPGKPGGKFKPRRGVAPYKKRKKAPPQVLEIVNEHHISVAMAFKVHTGIFTLEQAKMLYKEKEERREAAKKICEKYKSIDFALACLLVKQNISPEQFLERKKQRQNLEKEKELQKQNRMKEDNTQEKAYQALLRYCENKTVLQLQRYGGKTQDGVIENFTPYEFYFATQKGVRKIHRLKIKYFCEEKVAAPVKKMVFIDNGIQQKKLRPSYGPEGRYKFPEGILQDGNEILLALHEGEMIRGKIIWFTPYDMLLQVGKYEVWVFRHAVVDCTLAKRAQRK